MRLKSLTEVLGWIIGIRPSDPLKSSEKTGKENERKGEEKRSQLSLDSSRTKIVNGVEPIKEIIVDILDDCLKDPDIKKPDEFFQSFTWRLIINVVNYNWLSKAPKNRRELEILIREYGYWGRYYKKMNRSTMFYNITTPNISNRKGVKVIPEY